MGIDIMTLDSIGYSTFVSAIFFASLATVAVLVRFYARKKYGIAVGLDDWLILVGLIFYYLYTADAVFGVLVFGGGQVYATPEEEIYNLGRYLKAEYFIAPASVMAISFIKFSIVAFYRRIFTVKLFMNISLVVGVVCVLWMITGMVGNLLYCIPMESFWDKAIEGKCFNFDNWFLAMETIDLLLDAIILVLPIKTIMSLQLSAHKKTTLLTIFLLGGFVVITGIIRIVLVYQPNQTLISFTKASLWTCIHLGVAILCACLPTYGPLWPSILSMGNSIRSLVSTRTKTTTTGKSSSTSAISANGSYYKRMAYSDSDQIHLTAVSVGEVPRTKNTGIRVERDFDVV